ncbi:MAG TPA: hypothetical protein VME17_25250 [Bryobacteraceae bacterium]|nr:hypothetical protein [Bryobacteraceae bacterium]
MSSAKCWTILYGANISKYGFGQVKIEPAGFGAIPHVEPGHFRQRDRVNDTNARIGDMNARIAELRAHVDSRFDEMRDPWRSELYRVEQVIDVRRKHLEERG